MEVFALESVKNFGEQVVVVWETGVLGTSIGEILTAIGIFYFFLVLRHLFSRFVMKVFLKVTQRTKTVIDDLLVEAVKKPLEFAFVVIGLYVASQTTYLSEDVGVFVTRITRSLIAFTIFWDFFERFIRCRIFLIRLLAFLITQVCMKPCESFLSNSRSSLLSV